MRGIKPKESPKTKLWENQTEDNFKAVIFFIDFLTNKKRFLTFCDLISFNSKNNKNPNKGRIENMIKGRVKDTFSINNPKIKIPMAELKKK